MFIRNPEQQPPDRPGPRSERQRHVDAVDGGQRLPDGLLEVDREVHRIRTGRRQERAGHRVAPEFVGHARAGRRRALPRPDAMEALRVEHGLVVQDDGTRGVREEGPEDHDLPVRLPGAHPGVRPEALDGGAAVGILDGDLPRHPAGNQPVRVEAGVARLPRAPPP